MGIGLGEEKCLNSNPVLFNFLRKFFFFYTLPVLIFQENTEKKKELETVQSFFIAFCFPTIEDLSRIIVGFL